MQSKRRMELERLARSVGYYADRDDTDSDLVSVCRARGLHWVN